MTWQHRGRRVVATAAFVLVAALAMALVAGAQPGAGKNLIVNGDAEQGQASPNGYDVVAEIPGWIRKGGFTVVSYGAADFPSVDAGSAISGGSSFFAGGPGNAASFVSQQISVVSMKKLIDTGKAKATLSGYLGGYGGQDDSLTATAVFLDQAGKRLGSVRIGPVTAASRKLQTGVLKKTATRPIAKQTRTIKVILGANRTAGNYNDGYADNLSLTIGR